MPGSEMQLIGKLSKLSSAMTAPIAYQLVIGDTKVPLNALLGKKLSLQFQKIICMGCGNAIKKTYSEGYCYPCTQKLARCDLCILKPERCHFDNGTCREPAWGQSHCMIKHIVYIANATGPKVGITRHTNVPYRWIDQGAISALPIFETQNRRISGFLEVMLAEHLSDKTNWRKMLNNQVEPCDLFQVRDEVLAKIQENLKEIEEQFGKNAYQLIAAPQVYDFKYPVLQYPSKIHSHSFDKTPKIEGTLQGIKGQYLLLDTGVLNIRKHSGYVIELSV